MNQPSEMHIDDANNPTGLTDQTSSLPSNPVDTSSDHDCGGDGDDIELLVVPLLQTAVSTTGPALKTLEDFELLSVIGRGSYGKCFLVRRYKNQELLAMKVMRKRDIIKRNVSTNIKDERAVLENIDHPFLVKLRYAFQTDEKLYLLMTYVSGGELFTRISREGGCVENDVRFYAAEVAVALNYLHENGIIYRDLKPENVLIQHTGHICMTDFGFAKQFARDADSAKTTSFCGSTQYLAPEIVLHQPYDKAVDWWTFGIFIYELLTTETPFSGKNSKETQDNITKKGVNYKSWFSNEVKSLISGLLKRKPSARLSFEQIKAHPFFKDIKWDDVEKSKLVAPYIPPLKSSTDTQFFDSRFTNEACIDSPATKPTKVDPTIFRTSEKDKPKTKEKGNPAKQCGEKPQSLAPPPTAQDDGTQANLSRLSNRHRDGLQHQLNSENERLSVHQQEQQQQQQQQAPKRNPQQQTIPFPPPSLHPELPECDTDGLFTLQDSDGNPIVFRNSIREDIPSHTTPTPRDGSSTPCFISDDHDDRNVFKGFGYTSASPALITTSTPHLASHIQGFSLHTFVYDTLTADEPSKAKSNGSNSNNKKKNKKKKNKKNTGDDSNTNTDTTAANNNKDKEAKVVNPVKVKQGNANANANAKEKGNQMDLVLSIPSPVSEQKTPQKGNRRAAGTGKHLLSPIPESPGGVSLFGSPITADDGSPSPSTPNSILSMTRPMASSTSRGVKPVEARQTSSKPQPQPQPQSLSSSSSPYTPITRVHAPSSRNPDSSTTHHQQHNAPRQPYSNHRGNTNRGPHQQQQQQQQQQPYTNRNAPSTHTPITVTAAPFIPSSQSQSNHNQPVFVHATTTALPPSSSHQHQQQQYKPTQPRPGPKTVVANSQSIPLTVKSGWGGGPAAFAPTAAATTQQPRSDPFPAFGSQKASSAPFVAPSTSTWGRPSN